MASRRRLWIVWLLAAVCWAASSALTLAAETPIRAMQDKSTVAVSVGDRPLLVYRHGDVPFKPYVARLFTPGGVQILRDSPADHKHHHALMFAIGAGGVDFWSETPKCGHQKGRTPSDVKTAAHNGVSQAEFSQDLDWVGPDSDKPIMIERRTLAVSPASGGVPATLVTWRTRLQAPPGTDAVKLHGSHYFGLGMRFITSMDKCGRFFNSEGKPGDAVRGSESLTPAKWCAYTASADGKPVTVAVFDHPSNPRHPARIFTMCPFAYLSATLNLWKEPMTLQADKPLSLCYGLALWDGETDAAAVDKVYQRWAESNR